MTAKQKHDRLDPSTPWGEIVYNAQLRRARRKVKKAGQKLRAQYIKAGVIKQG